jgi:hypothetical protein
MINRLANVIYWLCTAIAVVLICIGSYGMYQEPSPNRPWIIGITGGIGAVIWLIGRATRYVLSGR